MPSDAGLHNPRVVDVASLDEEANVFRLIMVETRPYRTPERFIQELVSKVNAYLSFVEGGGCSQLYPECAGMRIVFQLDHFTDLPEDVLIAVNRLDAQLQEHGLGLVISHLD